MVFTFAICFLIITKIMKDENITLLTEKEKNEMRVADLSFDFAKRIVLLRKYLISNVVSREYDISRLKIGNKYRC